MLQNSHKNSKKIQIKRSVSHISGRPREQANTIIVGGMWTIGSYYEGGGSKRIASGLSYEEIDLLMPKLIKYPKTHDNFYIEAEKYFRDINTNIPVEGLDLEIGLLLDNTQPVTYTIVEEGVTRTNLPINIEDYTKYRQIIKHPMVAQNEKSASTNSIYRWYMFDYKESVATSMSILAQREAADTIYYSIRQDSNKLREFLIIAMPRGSVIPISLDERALALKKIADISPAKIIEIGNDQLLTTKVFINDCITKELITIIGNYYVLPETQTQLGVDINQVCQFLLDKKNADVYKRLTILLNSK